MDDRIIVELFWQRSPQALDALDTTYGSTLRKLAENLLGKGSLQAVPILHTALPGEIPFPGDFPPLPAQFLCLAVPIGDLCFLHLAQVLHPQGYRVVLPGKPLKTHGHQPHDSTPLKRHRIPPAVTFHFPGNLLGPFPAGHCLLVHARSSFPSHPDARNTAVPDAKSSFFHRHPV